MPTAVRTAPLASSLQPPEGLLLPLQTCQGASYTSQVSLVHNCSIPLDLTRGRKHWGCRCAPAGARQWRQRGMHGTLSATPTGQLSSAPARPPTVFCQAMGRMALGGRATAPEWPRGPWAPFGTMATPFFGLVMLACCCKVPGEFANGVLKCSLRRSSQPCNQPYRVSGASMGGRWNGIVAQQLRGALHLCHHRPAPGHRRRRPLRGQCAC